MNKPTVRLLSITNDIPGVMSKVWQIAKDQTPVEKMQNIDVDAILSADLPTSEFINTIWCVEGMPRAFWDQFDRSRHAAFWEQSVRILDLSHFATKGEYWLPNSIAKDPGAEEKYRYCMHEIQSTYNKLIKMGVPSEEARGVLPLHINVRGTCCINLRALKQLISNRICLSGDTEIPLLNGTKSKIRDLPTDSEFWVYSINSEGEIVPGKAKSLGITKENSALVRIKLDGGTHFDCTPDHPVMLRDGRYRDASMLRSGDSLMPLYRKMGNEVDPYWGNYEFVYSPKQDKYVLTHHLTILDKKPCTKGRKYGYVRHHKNTNSRDNSPTNLEWMCWKKHKKLHFNRFAKLWKDPEFRKRKTEQNRELGKRKGKWHGWKDPVEIIYVSRLRMLNNQKLSGYKEKMLIGSKKSMAKFNSNPELVRRRIEASRTPEAKEKARVGIRLYWKKVYVGRLPKPVSGYEKAWKNPEFRRKTISAVIESNKRRGKLTQALKNHKVVSVVRLKRKEDVYDLSVEKYHNFAIEAGVFVHNCFIAQGSYWLPVVHGMMLELAKHLGPKTLKSIAHLPCYGKDKCPIESNVIPRITGKDPNPPCPIYMKRFLNKDMKHDVYLKHPEYDQIKNKYYELIRSLGMDE